MDKSESTGAERRKPADTKYKPGQSGNPAGRPLGARHKFNQAFWEALHAEWQKRGQKAFDALSDEEFVKLAATKVPAQVEVAGEDGQPVKFVVVWGKEG